MNILSISSDRKLFEAESAVAVRMRLYGGLVEKFHIVVAAKRSLGLVDMALSSEVFLHPTNALTRAGHIVRALAIARALARRGMKFDVVTAQDPFELGFAAFLIARMLRARLHVQVHTDFVSPHFAQGSFMNRIRVPLAKFLIRRADAVRVVSERIKDSLSTFDSRLSTAAVLPIFVDTERIICTPIQVSLKGKYPQFEKHILMASRWTPEKNIGLAIRAMGYIVKNHPRTGLVIVGSGPEGASLKELTRALGVEKNISFEGWRDDLVSYYKTADLFLLTSNYEGYGMTVVEALAAGCPVLMTDVGCAGEVVHDGNNGLVVPVGDLSALMHALEQILSGTVYLTPSLPPLPSQKEYLAQYRKSWEDALK